MDLQIQIMTFNIIIDALLNAGWKDDPNNLFAAISDNGFTAGCGNLQRSYEKNLIKEGLLEESENVSSHGEKWLYSKLMYA